MTFEEYIVNDLESLKEQDLYRKLFPFKQISPKYIEFDGKQYCNLSSNDYLSLSFNQWIKDNVLSDLERFPLSHSSSRLICGSSELFDELEYLIADFKGKEAALVFNSGYSANLGVIQSLSNNNTVFLADKYIHASMIDGLKLSAAKFKRFKHNDINHLEAIIRQIPENVYKWVLLESVYSMDGDLVNLEEIIYLKKKYPNLYIYLDEAHGTGIFGPNGRGLSESLTDEIDIILGTCGKALGSFGAFIASSQQIKDYLINKCRSFIYSTSLAPVNLLTSKYALCWIKENPHEGSELLKIASYLRSKLTSIGFNTSASHSQIIPVILESNEKALRYSRELKSEGFWLQAIRYPTVGKNEARLRISLNTSISYDELNRFIEVIKAI